MENNQTLFKGELMEELLRHYFHNLGYYVVRSIKFKYEGFEITDLDLYLYSRSSSLTRHRINVDIKNKKSPQAFERILWANGLMKLLGFDSCIVATTDRRPVIHSFGQIHNTIILDGTFLSKLRPNSINERLPEEELLNRLERNTSYKTFNNSDWKFIYETSKSRLLTELDFSGFNSTLSLIVYFIEKIIIDKNKIEDATRMMYIIVSHLLVIIDFIVKDIAFLDTSIREKKLSDGFKFGNLGKDGVDKIISMAVQISGNKSANSFQKSLEGISIDILKDFFSKNENAKNLFSWAKEFESLGFNREFIIPDAIPAQLKGVLSVLLDYAKVERRGFFERYEKRYANNKQQSFVNTAVQVAIPSQVTIESQPIKLNIPGQVVLESQPNQSSIPDQVKPHSELNQSSMPNQVAADGELNQLNSSKEFAKEIPLESANLTNSANFPISENMENQDKNEREDDKE